MAAEAAPEKDVSIMWTLLLLTFLTARAYTHLNFFITQEEVMKLLGKTKIACPKRVCFLFRLVVLSAF